MVILKKTSPLYLNKSTDSSLKITIDLYIILYVLIYNILTYMIVKVIN